MATSNTFNSEIEKTNLEVHVDMSRQRYAILEEKVETIDERVDRLTTEISEFRKEHAQNIAELKQTHTDAIAAMREEAAEQSQSTTKVIVGAAGTVVAGLLSTIVVLLVAFI